ncbi:hypothetical protein BCR34DRAFT_456350, partial [Clohesyomyces aquaticus]
IDRASQVLAKGVLDSIPKTYLALAAHGNQYLTPCKENAVVEFLLHITSLGQPIRIKYVAAIAFSVTC